MHEYSIVQAMFDRIEEVARERRAASVRRISVRIGDVSGLDVELFRKAFEVYRERTICDGAELAVEVPAGDEITLMQLDLEVP
jgi:Zn finger protein HypA/HybF involved in hydrogenase expression